MKAEGERPDDGYWSGAVNGLLIQRFAWWRDKHPAWRTDGETLRGFHRARSDELCTAGSVTIVTHSGILSDPRHIDQWPEILPNRTQRQDQ